MAGAVCRGPADEETQRPKGDERRRTQPSAPPLALAQNGRHSAASAHLVSCDRHFDPINGLALIQLPAE